MRKIFPTASCRITTVRIGWRLLACCALAVSGAGAATSAQAQISEISASAWWRDTVTLETKSSIVAPTSGLDHVEVSATKGPLLTSGGYAAAKDIQPNPVYGGHAISIGSLALARALEDPVSGHQLVGNASASVVAEYDITVKLDVSFGNNPFASLAAQACKPCNIATSFQHTTDGIFAWDTPLTGGQARYSENLALTGTGGTAAMKGGASVVFSPFGGGQYRIFPSGAFSTVQLSAFPVQAIAIDPNWTLPLQGQRLSFGTVIPDVMGDFTFYAGDNLHLDPSDPLYDPDMLEANYHVSLTQDVFAQFVSGIGPQQDTSGDGVLMADFLHTSHLGIGSVFDPSGTLDLSNVPISVTFTRVGAVPLPAACWGMLAGFGMIARRRRRAS